MQRADQRPELVPLDKLELVDEDDEPGLLRSQDLSESEKELCQVVGERRLLGKTTQVDGQLKAVRVLQLEDTPAADRTVGISRRDAWPDEDLPALTERRA